MSGSHRGGSHRAESYRGSGGGTEETGGTPYQADGAPGSTPGDEYGSAPYSTGPYGSGSYGTGAYSPSSGGYNTPSGAYPTPSGTSGGYPSPSETSGAYSTPGDPYGLGSGSYGTGSYESGDYALRSGSYEGGGGSGSGGAGGSRRSAGSGGYRSGSGSHRIVRERRKGRRWAVAVGGVVAGVGACVLAAFAIMSGVGASGGRGSGQVVGGAAESSPMSKAERSMVPDACEVADKLAAKLAPGAERNVGDNYQGNDRQSQCVWGAYSSDRRRQLTVELRAVAGAAQQSPTDAARRSFENERRDDESGKALLSGQELTDKTRLTDLGDEGYAVYSVDKGQGSGEAVANVRVVNVLVTVHYSGANDSDPLSANEATDGAVEAARGVVKALDAN
ncbi:MULTISPECIES: hypothetical protein [Actinomadura]|uniref:DUF3558 domain-containing protein n=1 Tax=Actinomadura yumaensis TaxID=111807 RepID=A0ABW2CTD7_9ACTN|nr:hypothetical protein [Actinomadura sp. J1-007]MWK35968.1 hypothetical protein [Actinomadura sp. J1-007]